MVFGPIIPIGRAIFFSSDFDREAIKIQRQMMKRIPDNATVVTTYAYLTNLSSRVKIYPLNYIFIGQKQYSTEKYPEVKDADYLLVNYDDLITYHLQYGSLKLYRDYYNESSYLCKKNL